MLFTLWFLYLAGTALEKHWGTGLFLGIFLACGMAGGMAYLIAFGSSDSPSGFALLGPKGSMAGLMAAFALTATLTGALAGLALGASLTGQTHRTTVMARV